MNQLLLNIIYFTVHISVGSWRAVILLCPKTWRIILTKSEVAVMIAGDKLKNKTGRPGSDLSCYDVQRSVF